MPPRGNAKRGATVRQGRGTRRGRNERVDREDSQRGEYSGNPMGRQEEEVRQSENQNPPNQFLMDFVAALVAHDVIGQPPRTNSTTRAMEVVREFHRVNPPKFDGRVSDPLMASHWLTETRQLFELLEISEDHLRVRLMTCQLVGEANGWWQSVLAGRRDARRAVRAMQRTDEPDIENITWAEFEREFENQYFPVSFRDNLKGQFEKLEQGAMTVSDYAIQFQSLSRFALEMVSSEEEKCRRFVKGLNYNIRRYVLGGRNDSFHDKVEVARRVESVDAELGSIMRPEAGLSNSNMSVVPGTYDSQSRKRTRNSFPSDADHSIFMATTSSGLGVHSTRTSVTCHRCGQPGHFRAQCPLPKISPPPRIRTPGSCYDCGEFGHVANSCPHKGRGHNEYWSARQPRRGQGSG